MTVDVICSWCNKHLRTKVIGDNINDKHRVTHTICHRCKDEVMREYKKSVEPINPDNRQNIRF